MKKRLSINLTKKNAKELPNISSGSLIVGVYEGPFTEELKIIDEVSNSQLRKLRKLGELKGKLGQGTYLPALSGVKAQRTYLIGCGKKEKKLSRQDGIKVLSKVVSAAISSKASTTFISIPKLNISGEGDDWVIQQLAFLCENNSYTYDAKLNKKNQKKVLLKRVSLSFNSSLSTAKLNRGIKVGLAIGRGSNAAKDLANLPGNVCTPSYLAKESRSAANKYSSLKCSVLGEKEMKKLGMDCLLSVGAGSAQESKLITLNYQGGKKGDQPHVIVGKGITFDTGGISLKPGATMDEMKFDMCGAASVIGTMQVMAELKVPINIVGVVASAENMPGGKATKPGDVVKTMSGLTVEILNTDAEGRLVLADALTYVKKFNPKSVVDIATLTGACIVALGHSTSGLLSNDDRLAQKLLTAGTISNDRAWQLPIWDVYQKDLDSNFADIANIGGRAGTITAACFLSRFTKDYSWAHLDVAGTAHLGGAAKGASGRPVPLLSHYLLDQS
ncbi:MAG TPA: leucyl aminopeptidase [Gammaproteobacteria bacterium]|nr:leucyl aminopeptidase [Gammaproteobacteria bacterium]